VRVAIVSFLFNWPSTGGGNHHTAELAAFLARAGYEVRHFFAQYPSWGIGRITDELISQSEGIGFDETSWNIAAIQARFRRAVDAFAPDYVMITDSWNMKPYLAEAVRGYPYFLLYQAQENICPLNNLRLLATGPSQVEQCPRNQLATPEVCCRCLAERGRHSGALHQAERELAGVGTQEYYGKLRQSLSEAEAVLVLNPVIAALLEPYCGRVRIVPWGMDQTRFPWPLPARPPAYRIKDEARDRAREGEAPTEPRYTEAAGEAGSQAPTEPGYATAPGEAGSQASTEPGYAKAPGEAGSHGGSPSRGQLGAGLTTPPTEGPQVSRASGKPDAFGAVGPAAPALGAGLMTLRSAGTVGRPCHSALTAAGACTPQPATAAR
jgi:hypothetical protein